MKKMTTDSPHYFLAEWICGAFIFLFTYTAIHKILEPEGTKIALYQSPLLSHIVAPLQVAIPLAEITVALLLFSVRFRRAGLWGSLCLMSLFTLYIVYMFVASPYLPCSCGGIIQELSWGQHLLLNLCLIGLAILGIHLQKKLTVAQKEAGLPV